MPTREELKKKLKAKINEKRVQEGRQTTINHKELISDSDILESAKSMIADCQLPMIKRLNVRQRYNILEKKYSGLRKRYMPIFRSILNDEINMNNVDMLEWLIQQKTSANDQQMNDFLTNKYKLGNNEKSKDDNIKLDKMDKEFKNYLDKEKK